MAAAPNGFATKKGGIHRKDHSSRRSRVQIDTTETAQIPYKSYIYLSLLRIVGVARRPAGGDRRGDRLDSRFRVPVGVRTPIDGLRRDFTTVRLMANAFDRHPVSPFGSQQQIGAFAMPQQRYNHLPMRQATDRSRLATIASSGKHQAAVTDASMMMGATICARRHEIPSSRRPVSVPPRFLRCAEPRP